MTTLILFAVLAVAGVWMFRMHAGGHGGHGGRGGGCGGHGQGHDHGSAASEEDAPSSERPAHDERHTHA